MSFYLIRIGEGSKYIGEAKQGSFVAIGWNEVGDISRFSNIEQVKKSLQNASYNYTLTLPLN